MAKWLLIGCWTVDSRSVNDSNPSGVKKVRRLFVPQVYMDPLKKIQVEGYSMFAEPELLFGNLDELCCVSDGVVYTRHGV